MSQTTSGRRTGQVAAVGSDGFDFERWEVYRAAREFQVLVPRLLPHRGYAAWRDQLNRASASFLLNLAEGAGRFARADKARYYVIARGLLDLSLYRHARGLLLRVCQMLTKLTLRMVRVTIDAP